VKVRLREATALAVAALMVTAAQSAAAPGGVIAFGSWRCGDGSESGPPDYVGSGGPRLCHESIWRVNDDGSDLRRLTLGRSDDEDARYAGGDRDPAWSPDGTEIVFSRYMQSERGRDVLWVMNADGSNQRRLLKEPLPDGHVPEWEPDWSPDGQHIAFHSWSVGHWGPTLAVFIVNRDGSGARRLTPLGLDASEPEFTPDGHIVYQQQEFASPEESDRRRTIESGVYVMNADGSDRVRLTQGHRPLYRWRLSAAPDMRHITFGNSSSAYMLGLEDGAVRELPEEVHDPVWTSDGRSIVYTDIGQPPTSLFRLDPFDARLSAQLTDSTSLDRGPDWTPIAGAPPPERVGAGCAGCSRESSPGNSARAGVAQRAAPVPRHGSVRHPEDLRSTRPPRRRRPLPVSRPRRPRPSARVHAPAVPGRHEPTSMEGANRGTPRWHLRAALPNR
jgi:Tol biopolymer transport system component